MKRILIAGIACCIVGFSAQARAACATMPQTPVGWWKAELNGLDSTFFNNDATLTSISFNNGEVGKAFNTTNGSIVVPASASMDVGTNAGFTVEGWIYSTLTNASQPIYEWGDYYNGTPPGTLGVHVWIAGGTSGGDLYANLIDKGGNNHTIYTAAGAIFGDRWQHIALTYNTNSGEANLYVNGALAQNSNLGSFVPKTDSLFRMGERTNWTTFQGSIDETAVFDRALTALEIKTIYMGSTNGKCPCASAPAGLAGWWKAETNGLDSTANHNDAAVVTTSYASGQVGQAFDISSYISSDTVTIPASASLDVGTNNIGLTVEAWIYPTDDTYGQPIVEWGDFGGGTFGPHLWISASLPGDFWANFVDTSGTSHGLGTPAYSVLVNQFQHVAMTYDQNSGYGRIYLNGDLVAESNLGIFTPRTSGEFRIGNRPWWADWMGLIDETAVYNRPLSHEEVRYLFSLKKCECAPVPTDLVAWWKAEFNGDDSTANNNDASVANTIYLPAETGQGFFFTTILSSGTVTAPASATLDVGTNSGLTVEGWIYPLDDTYGQPIFEWGTYANNGTLGSVGPHLWISVALSGDFYANFVDTSGNVHAVGTSANAVMVGQYQHVAMTYDKSSGVGRIYLNGCKVAESNLGTFTPRTGNEFRIGNRPSWADWQGLIDETSVYRRALTPTEIQDIYTSGSVEKCF